MIRRYLNLIRCSSYYTSNPVIRAGNQERFVINFNYVLNKYARKYKEQEHGSVLPSCRNQEYFRPHRAEILANQKKRLASYRSNEIVTSLSYYILFDKSIFPKAILA